MLIWKISQFDLKEKKKIVHTKDYKRKSHFYKIFSEFQWIVLY